MVSMKIIADLDIPLDNIERIAYCYNCLFVIYANSNNVWEIIVYRIKKHAIQCVVDTISTGVNKTNVIYNFVVNDCRMGDNNYTPTYKILVRFKDTIKLFTSPNIVTVNLHPVDHVIDVILCNLHCYILTLTDTGPVIEQYNIHSSLMTLYQIPDHLLPHKNCIDRWKLAITGNKMSLLVRDERNSVIVHIANVHDTLEFVHKITYLSNCIFSDDFDRVIINDKFLFTCHGPSLLLFVYNINLVFLHFKSHVIDMCTFDNNNLITRSSYPSTNRVTFYRIS